MIFDIKKFTNSKPLKVAIITIVILAIASFVFQAGVFVGFHKASFLFKNGDNFYNVYGKNSGMMGGRGEMHMNNFLRDEYSSAHGAVGKIVKISLPNIVVLGSDGIEKNILTDKNTIVKLFRDNSSAEKLTIDQNIAVLGSPDAQGQIVAKLIRVLPSKTASTTPIK